MKPAASDGVDGRPVEAGRVTMLQNSATHVCGIPHPEKTRQPLPNRDKTGTEMREFKT